MTVVTAPPAAVETLAPKRKAKRPFGPASIIKYALALFFLIVVLMPLYVLIVTSFKAGSDIGVTTGPRRPGRRRGRRSSRRSSAPSSWPSRSR